MKKTIQILFLTFGLMGVMVAQAQNVNVSGKVTDSNGETLPGVNVVLKGTTIGITTNIDGNYTLIGVKSNATLVFSFIGFRSLEIPINGQSTINASLEADVIGIEEVVAIGYGTMRKSDLTGSVSSVKSEDLMERPSSNLGQALQGKASGVMVRTTSAAPGGGVSIVIRGHNSINSDSDPLYIVNGVPLSNINTIPVEDIESVEVLKDASSTAIYGARGANGVILITTKRGSAKAKPEITYSTRFTLETIPGDLNMMNGEEFGTFYSEWELGTGAASDASKVWYNGSDYDQPLPSDVGEGTDWFDAITRTGFKQNHLISVNGGNEKTTYAMSLNYLDHKGLMIAGQYDRISIKSSISTKITDWMDTGMDLFLSHDITKSSGENTGSGSAGLIGQAIQMSPLLGIYAEDGVTYQDNSLPASQTLENPVATAKEVEDYDRLNRAFGNVFITVRPLKDLSVKFSVGGDVRNNKSYYYKPTSTIYGALSGGSASLAITDNSYVISENIATYKKEIGIHKFDIVGGFTYEQQIYEKLGASASGFISDVYLYNNLSAASTFNSPTSNKTKWSLASGLGRINYSLANKYLLTFTGRYDGSSRFGDGNKWGFFPSAAGAWRFSEEAFTEDLSWLTYGKLRASWGSVGNQNIGLYGSQPLYSSANYPLGDAIISGVYASSLGNNNLKWETTETLDFGFDLGLFDRLTLNFDYYYKKTFDLLLSTSLIETSGFSLETMNVGELENKGWEFTLDAQIIDKAIKWDASVSIFHNENKIIKLIDPTQDWKIGYSTGATRGYIIDGIIRNQEELDAYSDLNGTPISGAVIGDYRRVDLNGDYMITTDDQVINFEPDPDFSFSINNEVSWKDLTFSMFLYGNIGGEIYNSTKGDMTSMLNVRSNYTRDVLSINNGEITRNYWTEDNIDAKYPRIGGNNYGYDLVENGSFLRIQNVMLSYNLPLKKVFTRSSIYFSIQNLYTFSNYSGWDPDVSSSSTNTSYGVDQSSYPVPRSFTMGLNVTF
jgi:TonB-linked SusC/RagA family outer membrane protein